MASFEVKDQEPLSKKPKLHPTKSSNNNDISVIDTKPMCKYGERCFRSSDKHKAEFQHPEITSIESVNGECHATNQNSNLPDCPNGINCDETDLIHFAEYQHPVQEVSEEICDTSKEENECDVVDVNEAWSSCCQTQLISDDDDEDNDADSSLASTISRDNTILSRGPSIVKCYSILSEEERKELIRRAFELKDLLKKELNETKEIIEKKNKALKRVHSQLEKVSKIDGEQAAMEKDELVYFPLFAEREFKEGSAAQIHFRLAESQFYRLVDVKDNYRVMKVEYIVNPVLMKRFKRAQQKIANMRGKSESYPILAFHGTKEENIMSISQTGFRVPGDSNFEHATDTGYYGRGVYFSEYPSYSVSYIKGASKLLLCQVLPGKVFSCTKLIHGEPLQADHDSHTSPDGKELVIFNSHHILPSYIVHYGDAKGDYTYEDKQ